MALAAAVATSPGIWVEVLRCWVLEPAVLSETLGLLRIPHDQPEALIEEFSPKVVMDVGHLCPHPVGLRFPGGDFHLFNVNHSSLKPF